MMVLNYRRYYAWSWSLSLSLWRKIVVIVQETWYETFIVSLILWCHTWWRTSHLFQTSHWCLSYEPLQIVILSFVGVCTLWLEPCQLFLVVISMGLWVGIWLSSVMMPFIPSPILYCLLWINKIAFTFQKKKKIIRLLRILGSSNWFETWDLVVQASFNLSNVVSLIWEFPILSNIEPKQIKNKTINSSFVLSLSLSKKKHNIRILQFF